MEREAIDRIHGLADEAFRAAEATWSAAFDTAQRTSDTRLSWDLEAAAWQGYTAADAVRQAAWQLQSAITAQTRNEARQRALAHQYEPNRSGL